MTETLTTAAPATLTEKKPAEKKYYRLGASDRRELLTREQARSKNFHRRRSNYPGEWQEDTNQDSPASSKAAATAPADGQAQIPPATVARAIKAQETTVSSRMTEAPARAAKGSNGKAGNDGQARRTKTKAAKPQPKIKTEAALAKQPKEKAENKGRPSWNGFGVTALARALGHRRVSADRTYRIITEGMELKTTESTVAAYVSDGIRVLRDPSRIERYPIPELSRNVASELKALIEKYPGEMLPLTGRAPKAAKATGEEKVGSRPKRTRTAKAAEPVADEPSDAEMEAAAGDLDEIEV